MIKSIQNNQKNISKDQNQKNWRNQRNFEKTLGEKKKGG